MAPVAGDVPGRYDVVVVTNDGTGYGFMLADEVEPNLPFRSHKALYSISPTFVQRQNISGNYGDNQQDFWLTQSQRDWSLGEQQKFFRSQGGDRQYWQGSNVDVSTPGQVTLAPSVASLAFAGAVRATCRQANNQKVAAASTTNLYDVDNTGAITDKGAHGLGNAPSKFGMATDDINVYLTTLATGTVGTRKWNGSVFSTFSATAADSLAFLNNTLYGFRGASSDFGRFDSAGTFTSIFTWKDASGGTILLSSLNAVLVPFGGQLLIAFPYNVGGEEASASLWIYDGTGVKVLETFPANFVLSDMEVLYGNVYIAGSFQKAASSSTVYNKPAVYFYSNGELGLLWQASDYNTVTSSDGFGGPHPALGVNDGRLLFTDDTMNVLMAYNPNVGGVSTIGSYTAGGTDSRMGASGQLLLHTRNATTGYYLPVTNTYPASGYVVSSLVDFDTSLNKALRGVTVQWDAASDGNGGTVDIAYQLDSLTGAYTTLQTGAVSGTEYTFPANTKGHSVSVKVTLNKGTSTKGPVFRRVNVRAAPLMNTYREREYLFHMYGPDGGADGVQLRDGTYHPKSGFQMAQDLQTIAQQTIPFTLTDKFGTYTMLTNLAADAAGNGFEVYEVHSDPDVDPKHPGSYLGRFYAREV